ncbi:MAG: ABC transporter permease [Acidobacteria bacterium]|nr:ABC transporter permease [Acidobacteriota bacterium]MBI3658794.1 ABC transporter permease [Acidobacteriota bacterium]
MFFRILKESFRRGAKPKAMVGIAILLGSALITTLLSFTMEVGDKIGRELARFGANLVITPQGASLPVSIGDFQYQPLSHDAFIGEAKLVRIKEMFWRHNILAFAPYLIIPIQLEDGSTAPLVGTWFNNPLVLRDGQTFATGVQAICSWWSITGQWVKDNDDEAVLIGEDIARAKKIKVGDFINIHYANKREDVSQRLRVEGVLRSGGEEDKQIFAALSFVQKISNLNGKVRKVHLSALTKPDDALARKDVKQMSPAEYDRWYCSPYVGSIAFQLKEALADVDVKPIRQVVEVQSSILSKTTLLVLLITSTTLLSMGLAVASTTSTTILQRRHEMALMKAIGASNGDIIAVFLIEAAILGFFCGMLGFGGGVFGAYWLGQTIFGTSIQLKLALLPLILMSAVFTTLLGSSVPLRMVLRVDPAQALHEI